MELAVMRFAGRNLPHNPKTLKAERSRGISSVSILGGKNVMKRIEEKTSKISGTGELYGKDCFEQYNELARLHFLNKADVLSVPGIGSFKAVLSDLQLLAEPKNGVISISFEFTRVDDSDAAQPISPLECHKAASGESLWDISYKYNIPIESLLALNPWIRNPWEIEVGKEVRLV